jgi:hypothetical protein
MGGLRRELLEGFEGVEQRGVAASLSRHAEWRRKACLRQAGRLY